MRVPSAARLSKNSQSINARLCSRRDARARAPGLRKRSHCRSISSIHGPSARRPSSPCVNFWSARVKPRSQQRLNFCPLPHGQGMLHTLSRILPETHHIRQSANIGMDVIVRPDARPAHPFERGRETPLPAAVRDGPRARRTVVARRGGPASCVHGAARSRRRAAPFAVVVGGAKSHATGSLWVSSPPPRRGRPRPRRRAPHRSTFSWSRRTPDGPQT